MRSANPTAKSYWRPVSEEGNGRQAHSVQSQISHTPSPKPQREPMATGKSLLTNSPHTPRGSAHSGERRSALERLSGELLSAGQDRALLSRGENSLPSGERRSALERLSGVPDRVPLLHNGIANSDSGRLQDVNIQYLEDASPYQTPPELLRASTSKAAAAGSAQEQSQIQTRKQAAREDSPIRTLSEDRAHVSLRLGPMPPLTGATSPEPTLSKAAGKRVTRAPPKSRVQGSPTKGVPVNKRKVTKAKSSSKRKLGISCGRNMEPATSGVSPYENLSG
ncbi:hypothetical protein F2Q70_00032222 [Brassica cretica]|uniref:Uncharacterized protein n=1 Tax=Brassica cretica TaxID=69181 RepID=A0A8S9FDD1_BRACR|nr:hypothetical protein F2Q70_00032222 [Brassica cretica]KAF2551144.1 hypothetical protein F2Q68_00036601 [Brassica cretica]